MTIQVRRSLADQLVAENTTAAPLEILADSGEAFLVIGRDGVRADLASPTWHRTATPTGVLPPSAPRTPGPPRLTTISRGSSWGWFDHRLHPGRPAAAGESAWTVPVRLGGRAHTVHGHVEQRPLVGRLRTQLTSVPPFGLTVQVLEGRLPGIFLRRDQGPDVIVRGRFDEPFARLSAAGTEVNPASPTWAEDRLARGLAPPGVVDPSAPPVWTAVTAARSLAWLDHRLAYAPGEPPEDVRRRREPTTLVRWEIGLRVGVRETRLTGTTDWVPASSADGPGGGRDVSSWALLVAALAAAGVVGAAMRLRRGLPRGASS